MRKNNSKVMGTDSVSKEDRIVMGRSREGVSFPTSVASHYLPDWYKGLFKEIKSLVSQARKEAVWAANTRMILTYYKIGKMILARQSEQGWGARVIDRLSVDLKKAFSELQGFSTRNLKYMRRFAEIWPDEEIVQRSVAQLSWRHNIILMEKVKEPKRRLAYAAATLKHGWSYNILDLQIKSCTLERTGKIPNNFPKKLPAEKSDMAVQIFKDPYLLDFAGFGKDARERAIEDALCSHMTEFLLELGQGFSYVGRQVHLEFADSDFYLDLLFYHLKLRCYVVVELKSVPFESGMMGQLNMYQAAVDDLLRHPDDGPTIGLLLVKNKNETLVKYSMDGFSRPVGIASWETKLTEKAVADLRATLPTIEEIEAELNGLEDSTK